MFPGNYFGARYFAPRYWLKTGDLTNLYVTQGDIKSRLLGNYLAFGDIETLIGIGFNKSGDTYALVLKRPLQQRISFTFDIQSQVN
jgi:hypothetical protein